MIDSATRASRRCRRAASIVGSSLAVILLFADGAAWAARADAHAATAPSGAKASEPAGTEVPYKELEQHVGDRIEIRSTYGTVRRGTLAMYTNVELTLKLEFGSGTIDLAVPRDTVASVRLLGGKPAEQGAREAASAKKN